MTDLAITVPPPVPAAAARPAQCAAPNAAPARDTSPQSQASPFQNALAQELESAPGGAPPPEPGVAAPATKAGGGRKPDKAAPAASDAPPVPGLAGVTVWPPVIATEASQAAAPDPHQVLLAQIAAAPKTQAQAPVAAATGDAALPDKLVPACAATAVDSADSADSAAKARAPRLPAAAPGADALASDFDSRITAAVAGFSPAGNTARSPADTSPADFAAHTSTPSRQIGTVAANPAAEDSSPLAGSGGLAPAPHAPPAEPAPPAVWPLANSQLSAAPALFAAGDIRRMNQFDISAAERQPAAPASAAALHAGTAIPIAPAQPPVAAIEARVGESGWDQALGDKLVWMSGRGHQVAELHLNPSELGPLKITLTLDHDQASAQFVCAHAPVRDAIEAAMPRLREMLADSGITLGNANVSTDAFRGQSQPQQQPRAYPGAPAAGMADPGALAQGERLLRHARGLVDTFA